MAGRPIIQCVGPSYTLADRKSAVQRAVNLFMREVEGVGESRQVVLASAPGLSLNVELGATARGHYVTASGRRFIVAGPTLYEIIAGAATSRGALATVAGFVCMKQGRDQLVLVDGANGYVLNLASNVLTQITSPAWRGSNWVDELDGYFIFVDPETDQFYLSAIDDGSTLDALDFSSADAAPDDVVTHRVMKRELYLLGSRSIEVWVNSGNPDFPLVRYNSTPIDVGVVGVRAAIRAADTLFFVGQTERGRGTVYEMVGHQPIRRSHQAVEEALATSTDLAACSMWTYQSGGNEFIAVTAPGMATTWVYDAATKQWHERGELSAGAWVASRIDEVVCASGLHYATAGTKSYLMSGDLTDLAGDPLVRERTWPHLMSPNAEPISYRSLEIACKTGHGGNVTLEISSDGGFTWGPPLLRSLGTVGRWMQRVRWHFLGSARDRVFRLRCSDSVPFAIHGATVEAG